MLRLRQRRADAESVREAGMQRWHVCTVDAGASVCIRRAGGRDGLVVPFEHLIIILPHGVVQHLRRIDTCLVPAHCYCDAAAVAAFVTRYEPERGRRAVRSDQQRTECKHMGIEHHAAPAAASAAGNSVTAAHTGRPR